LPCLCGSVVQTSSVCSKYRDMSLLCRQPIFHIQAEEPCTYYPCTPSLCSAKRKASPHLFVCFCRQGVPDLRRPPLDLSASPDFTRGGWRSPASAGPSLLLTRIHSASRQGSDVRCFPYGFSIQPFYSLYGDRKVLPHLTLLLSSVLYTASIHCISRPKLPALAVSSL